MGGGLQDYRGFFGVSVAVDGDGSGNPGKSGYPREGIPNGGVGRVGARPLEGFRQHQHPVVAQGRHGSGSLGVALGVFFHKRLNHGVLVVGREVGTDVVILDSFGAGQFFKFGGIPPVTPQEGNIQSHLSCLLEHNAHFRVVAGNEDHVRPRPLNFSQKRSEILIPLVVGVVPFDDFATQGFKGSIEGFAQTPGVVGGHVDNSKGLFLLEPLGGKLGHHLSLEVVGKTGAEDIISLLSHRFVGGSGGDQGHFGSLGDGGSGQGIGRGHGAKDDMDFIHVDKFPHRIGAFRGFSLVVLGDKAHLLAVNACGVDFFQGHLDAVHGLLPVGGDGTRQGKDGAYNEGTAACRCCCFLPGGLLFGFFALVTAGEGQE